MSIQERLRDNTRHTISLDAEGARKAAQLLEQKSKVGQEAANVIDGLVAERDQLQGALEEAKAQISYMHEKFQETGSGNGTIARIDRVLASLKGEGKS